MISKKQQSESNRKFLLKYAGLGSQILAAIAIGVFAGIKTDEWLHISPALTIALPLLILASFLYKLFKETSRTKKND